MTHYWPSLFGGMLIGLSAAMLMLLNGRVAGISGILGRLAQGVNVATNAAFVAGLVCGPPLFLALTGHWPAMTISTSLPVILVAGLMVGVGTRMGSGCTSGHGVVGIARLSPQSMIATVVFVVAGVIVVTLLRRALV